MPATRYLAVVTSSDRLDTQSFFRLACAFGFLSACAQVATVKNVTPVPPSAAAVSGPHAASARDEERSPEVALSQDLNVAARAWVALEQDPRNARSRQLYNYSVGRVVSLLQDTWKLPDAGAVTIRTGSSAYHLTVSSDIKLFDNPQQCHFIPADELALSGKDYDERVCRDGVGAPVLAETDNPVERAREQFLLSDRIYYGMTGVLQFHGKKLHAPTSIDTLSPNDRFVRILNTLPIADHTPYYSIVGDRGRGDTPHSSDGVVPYWSSHLDGAQSERIVPSGHSAHQNKEGMEEVDRILRLNLGR